MPATLRIKRRQLKVQSNFDLSHMKYYDNYDMKY